MLKGKLSILLCIFILIQAGCSRADEGSNVPQKRDARQLLITVLQTEDPGVVRDLLPRTTSGRVTQYSTTAGRYHDTTRTGQVRVLEGQTAILELGREVPEFRLLWVEERIHRAEPTVGVGSRHEIQGFRVRAVLEGRLVRLDIQHYGGARHAAQPHHQSRQMLVNTLSGQPGEWLDLGGTLEIDSYTSDARSYSTERRRAGETRLLVKVEPVN